MQSDICFYLGTHVSHNSPNFPEVSRHCFPDLLKTIGHSAFDNFAHKAKFLISFGTASLLETIGNNAFGGKTFFNSNNIVLPTNLKSVGDYAFRNINQAEDITIKFPLGIVSIGKQAFEVSLTILLSIEIPTKFSTQIENIFGPLTPATKITYI